jgi:hypothetical protein
LNCSKQTVPVTQKKYYLHDRGSLTEKVLVTVGTCGKSFGDRFTAYHAKHNILLFLRYSLLILAIITLSQNEIVDM